MDKIESESSDKLVSRLKALDTIIDTAKNEKAAIALELGVRRGMMARPIPGVSGEFAAYIITSQATVNQDVANQCADSAGMETLDAKRQRAYDNVKWSVADLSPAMLKANGIIVFEALDTPKVTWRH